MEDLGPCAGPDGLECRYTPESECAVSATVPGRPNVEVGEVHKVVSA